jgi:hypothetical protein
MMDLLCLEFLLVVNLVKDLYRWCHGTPASVEMLQFLQRREFEALCDPSLQISTCRYLGQTRMPGCPRQTLFHLKTAGQLLSPNSQAIKDL